MENWYTYGPVTARRYSPADEWCWSVGVTHWRLLGKLLQAWLPQPYSGRHAWTALREAPSVEWAVAYSLGWERASTLPEIGARELGEAEGGAE